MLDFARLSEWLIELDDNGCINVGFGGGEPTLYPRLAEICAFASQQTALSLSLTTHGHAFGGELLKELAGNLHFIRVSMDGVDATYESIRHRSFASLVEHIVEVSRVFPFGINYLVNSTTVADLDAAMIVAAELGASEFLLLPEEPSGERAGIKEDALAALRAWVENYSGSIPLSISEGGAAGFQTCDPTENESGILAFAHIDAEGILKKSSFDRYGFPIGTGSIMTAIERLQACSEVSP